MRGAGLWPLPDPSPILDTRAHSTLQRERLRSLRFAQLLRGLFPGGGGGLEGVDRVAELGVQLREIGAAGIGGGVGEFGGELGLLRFEVGDLLLALRDLRLQLTDIRG